MTGVEGRARKLLGVNGASSKFEWSTGVAARGRSEMLSRGAADDTARTGRAGTGVSAKEEDGAEPEAEAESEAGAGA